MDPIPALGREERVRPSCSRCALSPAPADLPLWGLWGSPGSWAAPVASALWENLNTHSPGPSRGDPGGAGERVTPSNLIHNKRVMIVSFFLKSSSSPGIWIFSRTHQGRAVGKGLFPRTVAPMSPSPWRTDFHGICPWEFDSAALGGGSSLLAGLRVCPALHLPGAGTGFAVSLLPVGSCPGCSGPCMGAVLGLKPLPHPSGAPRRRGGFTAVSPPFQCSGERRRSCGSSWFSRRRWAGRWESCRRP